MNQDLRKKLLFFMGIAAGLVILVLLIVWIVGLIKGTGGSFEKAEQTMKEAAIQYYKVHNNLLPTENSEISVDDKTLTEGKFMEPLNKLVKKSASCTGVVIVKKEGQTYSYVPRLDCGKDYSSMEFYKKLTDSKNIVTSGAGLYQWNGEYVYRGEDVNNYVKFSDHLYRVVRVTANNEVELILTDSKIKMLWDDRYNVERRYNVGINDYSVSRMRTSLTDLYEGDTLFTKSAKEKLVSFPVCYGKRGEEDASKDGSTECSKTLENQKIGLLPIYQYLLVSLDASCQTASDPQCQNYNYLAENGMNWWTLTGVEHNTYHVYSVNSSGDINMSQGSTTMFIRPVIRLSSLTMLNSGNGTFENPYIIK